MVGGMAPCKVRGETCGAIAQIEEDEQVQELAYGGVSRMDNPPAILMVKGTVC